MPQDEWNDEVLIGGHIIIQEDGPWVEKGPPTITRDLTLIGSCAAINSRGGALGGGRVAGVEVQLQDGHSPLAVRLADVHLPQCIHLPACQPSPAAGACFIDARGLVENIFRISGGGAHAEGLACSAP